jgi:hypothetical protein
MAQAATKSTTLFSRRSVLAVSTGVVVPFASAVPPTKPPVDPIFKAIARHGLAEDDLEAKLNALDTTFDFDRPSDFRTYRRLRKPVDQAAVALIGTVPTTAAGVAALLWYVHQNQNGDLSFSCDNILAVIKRRARRALVQFEAV